MSNTWDEAKAAEKIVNDLVSQSRDELPPLLLTTAAAQSPSLGPRAPEPQGLPGYSHATQQNGLASIGYRDLLRSRGRLAMQGINLWKPIAASEETAESRWDLSQSLPAAHALGLMWNVSPTTACSPEPMAQLSFDATAGQTAPSQQFCVNAKIPLMPPLQMQPIHAPAMALHNCDVNELLAIVMPGPLAGLSNLQIEERLRVAAAQVDIYND
jgi:hypothetical protein